MAKQSNNILEQCSRAGLQKPSAGMSVPEGYFDSFCRRMDASLPERPELSEPQVADEPRTFWQRVRPYVYMAAMFAGVWCMVQMFGSLSSKGGLQPIEDNPVLADALSTDDFVFDYIYDDISSWELVDDMMDEGTIDSDFEFEGLLAPDDESSPSTHILP